MKYGESVFDIGYLIFAIVMGVLLMMRKEKSSRYMGASTLVLGFGDAFHLIPRVLNYFVDADLTTALGLGKLITSITMTVFYILVFRIWLIVYKEPEKVSLSICLYVLALIRIILCLMPQNNWTGNESPVIWGIIRNIPGHDAACPYDHIAAYGHAWQHMDSAAEPDIVAHNDGMSVFQAGISPFCVNGVARSVESAVGGDEHVVPEYDFCRIEYHGVVIGEEVVADFDVVAVVAP